MVKVRWDTNSGALYSVSAADGPGQHTDDVDTETVRSELESIPNIGEEAIAEAVIQSYDGALRKFDCHVTADTYIAASGPSTVATTVAFVEVHDEANRQEMFECDSCDSTGNTSGEWDFVVRDEDGWVYHNWRCPRCESIVNTDLVEMPQLEDRYQSISEC